MWQAVRIKNQNNGLFYPQICLGENTMSNTHQVNKKKKEAQNQTIIKAKTAYINDLDDSNNADAEYANTTKQIVHNQRHQFHNLPITFQNHTPIKYWYTTLQWHNTSNVSKPHLLTRICSTDNPNQPTTQSYICLHNYTANSYLGSAAGSQPINQQMQLFNN